MPDPITIAPFALADAVPEGDITIRRGTIFECGNYADKDFSLTPEEAHAAVAAFTPVQVDLEHTSTPLDGKLGQLQSVAVGADGWSLEGVVALPTWLDTALGAGAKKVSCTWDRATKRITGLALVNTPRVSNAALMAAFAGKRHSSSDQSHVQAIHDSASALGAACPDNEPGEMPDDGPILPGRPPGVTYSKPAPAGKGKRMNLKEWLTGKAKEDGVELDDSISFGSTAPDPRIADLEAKIAARDAQFAAEKTAQRSKDAATFADAQVAALRILPAGRDALVALYASTAATEGSVTFANGGQHSPLETLTAVFAALPAHTLTQEMVLANGNQVLAPFSTPNPDAPMTAERRAQLLEMTSLGRSAASNGKSN